MQLLLPICRDWAYADLSGCCSSAPYTFSSGVEPRPRTVARLSSRVASCAHQVHSKNFILAGASLALPIMSWASRRVPATRRRCLVSGACSSWLTIALPMRYGGLQKTPPGSLPPAASADLDSPITDAVADRTASFLNRRPDLRRADELRAPPRGSRGPDSRP